MKSYNQFSQVLFFLHLCVLLEAKLCHVIARAYNLANQLVNTATSNQINRFPICVNYARCAVKLLIIFKITVYNRTVVYTGQFEHKPTLKCLSIGTPNTTTFPFVPNGKWWLLGVPILKHIIPGN